MANIVTNLMGGMSMEKLTTAFDGAAKASKQIADNLQKATKLAGDLGKGMKAAAGSAIKTGGQNMLGTGKTGNVLSNSLGSFNGNVSSAGQQSMQNAFGANGALNDLASSSSVREAGSAFNMLSNVVAGTQQFLPDVGKTVTRATGYYNATMFSGNRFPRATSNLQGLANNLGIRMPSVEDMTFKTLSDSGGMTSVGSDAIVAQYLTGKGMNVAGGANSTYQQTLRTIGNAGKYLNISNEAAAASVEGLTGAAGSSNMLRKFGIYTADLQTGKEKTQGQIFEELANRLTAGRKPSTIEQTQNDIRRGFLGVNIQAAFGNDQAGAEMFKQYMVERAGGSKMDLSSNDAMNKIYGGLGTDGSRQGYPAGNTNPMNALHTLNASDTSGLDMAEQKYLSGMNAAVPVLELLNTAAGNAADALMGFNTAFASTLGKSDTVKGLTKAGGAVAGWASSNALQLGVAAAQFAVGDVMGAVKTAAPAALNLTAGSVGLAGLTVSGLATSIYADSSINLTNQAPVNVQRNPGNSDSSGLRNLGGDSTGTSSTSVASYPTGSGTVNQYGGWHDPQYKKLYTGTHNGIDYRASEGTTVYSVSDGIVSIPANQDSKRHYAGTAIPKGKEGMFDDIGGKSSLGLHVKVTHSSGYSFWYCHLSSIVVSAGKSISKGAVIGRSGHTGSTDGPHLHFAVTDPKGTWVDPKGAIAKINAQLSTSAANSQTSGASSGVKATLDTANASLQNSGAFFGASAAQMSDIFTKLSSGDAAQMTAAVNSLQALSGSKSASSTTSNTPGTPGSSKGGNQVTVNLSLPDVSESSASKFAQLVKQYLNDGSLTSNMGSY